MTGRTITEFAALCGANIETNFEDTADYVFSVRNLWDIRTNLWFVIFTDEGIAFYVPKRGGRQLTSFTVSGSQTREGICENMR